ncbi:MAG: PEP-CTERM sorting domain-containing protein, partial [Gemmatimonadaceae bacterium]
TADPLFFFNVPRCGLGLGNLEGSLGGGDSGGPLFMNGKIAGVASYGLSFGTDFGDLDDDVNSTFGEFAGWTSTRYNEDWLASYAVVVPEPASFALVGMGLMVVFGVSNKRRRS